MQADRPILWTSTRSSGSIAHQVAMVSGLDVEARFISIRAGDTRKPEYLAINPKGQVPALQLPDGSVITEIPAILFWFAEAAPESGLLPPDVTGRAKGVEWLAWCHWAMARNFNPAFAPAALVGDDASAQQALRAASVQRATHDLVFAEVALGRAGGRLLGTERPSAPDIFLAGLLRFAGFLGIDTGGLPLLAALRDKVAALRGVAAAIEREQALG